MNATLLKIIGAAAAGVGGFAVVALAPKFIAELAAAGAAGFAVWKFVAAWELQKLLDDAKALAAKAGIQV